MNEEAIDIFIENATQSLGFLTKEYHFDSPVADIDRQTGTVTVTFSKGDLAIEASYELREDDISVKIVKLKNGAKPKGYYVDHEGRRCRVTLIDILLERGLRSFGFRPSPSDREKWSKEGGEGRRACMKWVLDRYKLLLKAHGRDILDGSLDVFNELEGHKRP